MTTLSYGGRSPRVHPRTFVAGGAFLIGDVELGEDASVWFHAVLRGDINTIRVGARTNIQDASVLHVTEEYPCVVGDDVTVGHRAIIHAATVGDCCLIGMGSIVLDNAQIGNYSLVAAGAVVLQNFVVPEGSLVAGVPAKLIRQLSAAERQAIRESAANYVQYARGFRP